MEPASKLDLRRDSRDPSRTLMLLDGKAVASIPWQTCDEIARAFVRAARAGEEQAKAGLIIPQEAALIRSGAPFALSNDAKIREQAYLDAQWDKDARRAMPLRGPPSPRQCGTPTLRKHRTIGATP